MPVGECNDCDRLFVIPSEESPERVCPSCRQLMRLVTSERAYRQLRGLPVDTESPVESRESALA